MTILRTAAVFLALSGCLGAALASDDAATIRAGTQAWMKDYNSGNAEGVAARYTADAVVMPPGAPVVKGMAAIKQYLVKDTAGAKAAGITLVLGSDDEVGVSGDMAWHSGSYTVKLKSGATVDAGSYMEVWRKVGGKWMIARDIWNSSNPPPPPPAAPSAPMPPAPPPKKK